MKAASMLVLFLLTFALGCGSHEPKPSAVYLFLFDATDSCKDHRKQYRIDFRNKIMTLEGARVYVDLISAANVPSYPIAFDVPQRKGPLAEYNDSFDRTRAELANAYDAELQALFRDHDLQQALAQKKPHTLTGDSNIILTLGTVTLFERNDVRDNPIKELCIFTDGIQQSPELDLTSSRLNLNDIDQTVERLEPLGLVPRLRGVTVKIGGLVAGKGKQLTAKQKILIRRFWVTYFEKSGARFNAADIDGAMID